MILVNLTKNDYANEILSLIRAFYPEEKVIFQERSDGLEVPFLRLDIRFMIKEIHINLNNMEGILYHDQQQIGEVTRKEYKNLLKRMLYKAFNKITGKLLPWGTLTGIRPAKLITEQLEKGIDTHAIKDHMEREYLCSADKINLSMIIAKKELEILRGMDYKDGYSIYIGIPFCPTTCLYCSFPSFPMEQYKDMFDDYLNALEKEMIYASQCFADKKLSTIYVGGGTPTTLSEKQLKRLLHMIRNLFSFEHVKEFTVEAGRPDSITKEKLNILKEADVTRISINPQTMNQKTLDLIGRKHSVNQIKEAFFMARAAGHQNINMDIIIGLPGEEPAHVIHTLSEIHNLNPDGLTVHSLALKRASNLNIYKEDYKDLKAKKVNEMMSHITSFAEIDGYKPYYMYRQKNIADNLENIGYAKEGKEGIYNILIMEERQTILALGAGGSSKFVLSNEGRIERIENVKNVKDYIFRIDEMIQRKQTFIESNF